MSEPYDDTRELDRAYEDGKTAGQRVDASQAACPFARERLSQRIAWLDGFSDGQWEARKRHSVAYLASSFFGSGIAHVVSLPHRI